MSRSLPGWADTPEARALIDAILLDPPETYVRSRDDWSPATERFSARGEAGKRFCALRRIHREWHERQLAALDAQYHVTGIWNDDASRELHHVEDAEALIRRLLKEAADEQIVDVEHLGPGRIAA